MLKTALKLKWIAALLGALLVATGFVALSGWQFGASSTEVAVKADETEVAVPFTKHYTPGIEMLSSKSDQIVTLSGEFVSGTDVLIKDRIDDDKLGFWVVSAFEVDGAPHGESIAIARGWQPEDTTPSTAPAGKITVTGRLLPPEGSEANYDVRNKSLATLTSAQLSNTWKLHLYAGFIAAHELTQDGAPVAQPGIDSIYVGPQPQDAQVNWLNIFYGVEWVVFAGFAFFLWYRMVRDDYQRDMDEVAEQAARAAAQARKPESGPTT